MVTIDNQTDRFGHENETVKFENQTGPEHKKLSVHNQCTPKIEHCIMETYSELLKRPEWKQMRRKILERDSRRCRNCASASGLEVHHRQYHKVQKTKAHVRPWNYEAKYLITLCNSCHVQGHSNYSVPTFYINQ